MNWQIEYQDGSTLLFEADSGTDAMELSDRMTGGEAIVGCREVASGEVCTQG